MEYKYDTEAITVLSFSIGSLVCTRYVHLFRDVGTIDEDFLAIYYVPSGKYNFCH